MQHCFKLVSSFFEFGIDVPPNPLVQFLSSQTPFSTIFPLTFSPKLCFQNTELIGKRDTPDMPKKATTNELFEHLFHQLFVQQISSFTVFNKNFLTVLDPST